MNELALFAGVGGGILGTGLLGWRTVCAVEYDPYAISVLLARQNDKILPPFPIWDDVCTFDGRGLQGHVDIISAGFPCPAFSRAARGRNKPEKDLWHEAARIIEEVRPTFFFGENVSREAINKAGSDLRGMGYSSRGLKLSAKDLGADHIRERYWILAYPHNQSQLLREVYAKMGGMPKLHGGIWETAPEQSGVDDGLDRRVDRLKATGNGQVSIVAAQAFRILAGKDF